MPEHPIDIFGLKTSTDFFRAFKEQVDLFETDTLSTTKAITCALFAWHLTDWVFHEYHYKGNPDTRRKELEDFQKYIRRECKFLRLMEAICNGTKHVTLTYDPPITSAGTHRGEFSYEFSRDFDISYLQINLKESAIPDYEDVLKDGTILDFEDVLDKVTHFWEKYLKVLGWKERA